MKPIILALKEYRLEILLVSVILLIVFPYINSTLVSLAVSLYLVIPLMNSMMRKEPLKPSRWGMNLISLQTFWHFVIIITISAVSLMPIMFLSIIINSEAILLLAVCIVFVLIYAKVSPIIYEIATDKKGIKLNSNDILFQMAAVAACIAIGQLADNMLGNSNLLLTILLQWLLILAFVSLLCLQAAIVSCRNTYQ